MKTDYLFIAVLAFFVITFSSQIEAQPTEFEKFVTSKLQERTVAGVSVARIENGKVVEQFALAHPDLDNDAVAQQTVFQVGSVSKPVAAWTVMTLIRDGKVELDAPIGRYVTRWKLPDSEFDLNQVTVRRLLSHTAGLSLHGYPGFSEGQPLPSIEESLTGSTGGSGGVYVALKPGAQFKYSGGGYTLLQLMVEEVTGMSFSEYAQQNVLSPLGMTSSSYAPNEELKSRRATPYIKLEPLAQFHFRAQAAASLHSTSGDLAKFALANMFPNPVLNEELINQMHAGEIDTPNNKVGLGFFIEPEAGIVGHSGANQGWRASFTTIPETGSGLIVLANGNNAGFFNYQVRCYWEEHFSKGALKESCYNQINAYNQGAKQRSVIALTLTVISLSLVVWRIISIRRSKARMSLPYTKLRWSSVILLSLVLIAGKALLNTSYGAYLLYGLSTELTLMEYAPEGIPEVWLSIQVMIVCVIGFVFSRSAKP